MKGNLIFQAHFQTCVKWILIQLCQGFEPFDCCLIFDVSHNVLIYMLSSLFAAAIIFY